MHPAAAGSADWVAGWDGAAGITGSGHGATLRLSFHLYNDTDHVAAAARLLGRHVVRRERP